MSEKHIKRITKKKLESFIISPPDEKDVDSCLANIYQDDEGQIPNMKSITVKKGGGFLKFLTFVFTLAIVCAGLAWAGFFYLPNRTGNSGNTIFFDIQGAREVTLGATTTYRLAYENKHDVSIKNATLSVYYPEGFVFITSSIPSLNAGHNEWQLGSIAAGKGGEISITGKYFGSQNEQKTWRTFFNYTPSNFNSELQVISTLSAVISKNPFSLEVTGPESIVVGADAEYTFTIRKNDSGKQPVQLAIVAPANFLITSSSPSIGKNNRVTIDWSSASSPDSATVTVRGKFKDSAASENKIKGTLYLTFAGSSQVFSVGTAEVTTQMAKSNLDLVTTINGSNNDFEAKPGDMLAIAVRLKNTSGSEMKNIVVELSFDAPALKKVSSLNWSAIEDKYDGAIVGEQLNDTLRRGEISWNSKKIPALAKLKQNDEITINIKLPLKRTDAFDFSSLKEALVKVNTSVDYTDTSGASKNIAASPIAITLVSDLAYEGRDTVTTNGQGKEEHSVTWILTNSFHPLKNIILTAEVYGDATYLTGNDSAGEIVFNPRDKKITWKIDEMPLNVDIANGTFTLVLNTKNPTQNTLLSKVAIEAEDALTGKKLTLTGKEIILK